MCNMYNQRKHHQDRIVTKRMKRANLISSSIDLVSEEVLQKVVGRARKTKPWDCGRPQCSICGNPRRVWKYRTRKEEMADFIQKEMLGETYG